MPALRGSELLYTFLAREIEFTTSFLPDLNFGKMMKSGAMKLVKEVPCFFHSACLEL
jgi:hypothetical protein